MKRITCLNSWYIMDPQCKYMTTDSMETTIIAGWFQWAASLRTTEVDYVSRWDNFFKIIWPHIIIPKTDGNFSVFEWLRKQSYSTKNFCLNGLRNIPWLLGNVFKIGKGKRYKIYWTAYTFHSIYLLIH